MASEHSLCAMPTSEGQNKKSEKFSLVTRIAAAIAFGRV
jgi:hypothetical protein